MIFIEAAVVTDEPPKEAPLIGASILAILTLATLILVASVRKPSPALVPVRSKRPKQSADS